MYHRIIDTIFFILVFACIVPAQSRLSVHGHLSQAYAFTNGVEFLGIPGNGTTDYRTLALQFGYQMTDDSRLVIQFGHKRLGLSPTMAFRDEIEVDWAFVDYWLLDNIVLKVGKVQLSMGIYNEIREVGTLLPFYRLPFYTYNEGWWTSATVDGVVLSSYLWQSHPWNLELHSFYGGWDMEQLGARAEDCFGTQIWLNTALKGLRVGLEGHRMTYDGASAVVASPTTTNWALSIDGSFSRVVAQAEYLYGRFAPSSWKGYYGYLGLRLTERLMLSGMADFNKLYLDMALPVIYHLRVNNRDYVLGIDFRLQSNVVLKYEHHWANGLSDPQNLFQSPADVQYGILSVSASF